MMILFDTTDMNVDEYLESIVEQKCEEGECLDEPYMIMNKDTFRLFKMLSNQYDKKHNYWQYTGYKTYIDDAFTIAISKKLNFGEVIIERSI